MKTVAVALSECMEGEVLAADVFNRNGVVLAAKDTVVNTYIKKRLSCIGVDRIRVYQAFEEKSCGSTVFGKSYRGTVLQIRDVLNDLAAGKGLDTEKVYHITDQIHKNIHDNEAIVKYLQETRSSDEYTYTHCINTAFYSMLLGKWLKLSGQDIRKAIQSGLLHDIGKCRVPAEILNKKGILTKDEYEIIKKHTIFGYAMLEEQGGFDPEIRQAVLLHHERMDSSGYPFNTVPEKLNLFSKIVAVADVFDAMTSDRVYKKRATPFEAFEMFQTVGVGIFDTRVMNALIKNIPANYVGSNVVLNNGCLGKIVYVPPQDILHPVIVVDSEYIDLCTSPELKIVSMV